MYIFVNLLMETSVESRLIRFLLLLSQALLAATGDGLNVATDAALNQQVSLHAPARALAKEIRSTLNLTQPCPTSVASCSKCTLHPTLIDH